MGAASRLYLDKEPLTALAIAAMLLAFARDRAEQAALRHDSALSVLKKLLQVPCTSASACSPLTVLSTYLLTDLHEGLPRCLTMGWHACSSSAVQP